MKERTKLFQKIGPEIAQKMSKALQRLTAEEMKVEFRGVRTFEQHNVLVDVQEKCFGSYLRFKADKELLEGIAVAIFPLSATKTLTELVLRRYIGKQDKEGIDDRMKLSAFKEAANILVLTYITGVADALKVEIKTGMPGFISLQNVEFIKPALLKGHSNPNSLVSVGQFRISGGDFSLLNAALLLFIERGG